MQGGGMKKEENKTVKTPLLQQSHLASQGKGISALRFIAIGQSLKMCENSFIIKVSQS